MDVQSSGRLRLEEAQTPREVMLSNGWRDSVRGTTPQDNLMPLNLDGFDFVRVEPRLLLGLVWAGSQPAESAQLRSAGITG